MTNIKIELTDSEVEFILNALDLVDEGASCAEHYLKVALENKIVDAIEIDEGE